MIDFLSMIDFAIYNKLKKFIRDNFIVNYTFIKNLFKIIVIFDLSFENINNNYISIYIFYEKSNNYHLK
jgi:hypothetical protein